MLSWSQLKAGEGAKLWESFKSDSAVRRRAPATSARTRTSCRPNGPGSAVALIVAVVVFGFLFVFDTSENSELFRPGRGILGTADGRIAIILGVLVIVLSGRLVARTARGRADARRWPSAYRNTLRYELKRAHTVDEAVEDTKTRLPWITTPDLLTVWAVAFGLKDEIDDLIRETFETARQTGSARLGTGLVPRQRRHRLGRATWRRPSARSARAPRRRPAPATAAVAAVAAAAPAAASRQLRRLRGPRRPRAAGCRLDLGRVRPGLAGRDSGGGAVGPELDDRVGRRVVAVGGRQVDDLEVLADVAQQVERARRALVVEGHERVVEDERRPPVAGDEPHEADPRREVDRVERALAERRDVDPVAALRARRRAGARFSSSTWTRR